MKVILPLLILLIASTVIFMHFQKVKHTEINVDGEDSLEYLEQGSLTFKADVNCQIGSRYIMGVGCEETIFMNAYELEGTARTRPVQKVEIKSFKVTSSSEVNKMTSHKAGIQGGGWGAKVKAGLDVMNKNFDTVNTVSVDLTDYRVHNYKYVSASQFELDEGDAYDFEDDPEFFFERNGYYFVIGFTTGSTFDGILNYKSTNSEVLKDVSTNVGASYGYGPFSVGGNYAYQNTKHTKNGDADFKSNLNVTGSSNDIWDRNDIKGSHDKYQETMNKDNMQAVAVTKWDSIRLLRDAIRNMNTDTKNKLREYGRVNSSFLKRISEAFSMYSFLQMELSQHIIEVGGKISAQQLENLRTMKIDIEKRLDRIQDLRYIPDLTKLNSEKYTDDLIEYEFKSVEVEKKMKEITGRTD